MYSLGMVPPTTLFSTVKPLPFSIGRHLEDDVAVLAAAAGLLDELAFAVRPAWVMRFAIGDLRRAGVGLDLELAQHAVADDFEVQFAHAGDDGLAGFLVGADDGRSDPPRRAAAARIAIFSWSALVFGSMAMVMTGSGKVGGSSRIS